MGVPGPAARRRAGRTLAMAGKAAGPGQFPPGAAGRFCRVNLVWTGAG